MKWSEFKRKAIKMGFVLDSHGKKHDIYIKDGVKVAIPRHDAQEAPKGIVENLKKQMGI